MNNLSFEIIPSGIISAELDKQIDQLDKLAFADENHDAPDFNRIDWSSHIEYMALGYMDGELVTLLGLLRR